MAATLPNTSKGNACLHVRLIAPCKNSVLEVYAECDSTEPDQGLHGLF